MEVSEQDGPTYAVQLFAKSEAEFNLYRDNHLHHFQQEERNAWGDDACSFASLMRVIN
jgi:hypothetical protein